jgi:hypothetical protein
MQRSGAWGFRMPIRPKLANLSVPDGIFAETFKKTVRPDQSHHRYANDLRFAGVD